MLSEVLKIYRPNRRKKRTKKNTDVFWNKIQALVSIY